MAVDITIDAIIRRNLAKRKVPLHYYGPVLVMAKDGLEELHFDSLQKVKHVLIDLDPDLMTGDLPADFVEEVAVGVEVGDKFRPIGFNPQINRRDDEGTPFEQVADLYAFTLGTDIDENQLVEKTFWDYRGRNFGRPVTFTDSYTILRDLDKIRIDNKSDITQVHLVYLTLPEKVSNQSVIHPFAKKSLESFINWQWAIYNKDRDELIRRKEFFNDNRIFRARKNKLTTTEIKRIFRKHFGLGVKN